MQTWTVFAEPITYDSYVLLSHYVVPSPTYMPTYVYLLLRMCLWSTYPTWPILRILSLLM